MVKVKICGIKRTEDALAAVRFGADAIGLLVGQRHAATDFITADEATAIVKALPPFCSSVLVTHLDRAEEIVPLARSIGVTTIQLHGDSSPEDARAIRENLPHLKLIKAVHVTDAESIEVARRYADSVDAILLDTVNVATDQVGGTGMTHDWGISRRIVETAGLPVILAGGLNPDNVTAAIEAVRPFGVDVNSGTKGPDGFKDMAKLRVNGKFVRIFCSKFG